MSVSRTSSVLWVLLAAIGAQGVASAATWQKVIAGRNETIEIDRSSIAPAASGATAWSRVILDREVKDPGGVYDTIRAQNLYDCTARRFTTLRRAFFNGEALVREDVVARQRANAVEAGSIDERLFNTACRALDAAPAANDAGVRGTLASAPGGQGERPAAMHADLRTVAADHTTPRPVQVADAAPAATAEKPKLIVLPPIDKAAADKAAAGSGVKPAQVPVGKGAIAAAPGHAQAPPAAAAKPDAAHLEAERAADKRQRELLYSTSGPRRAKKKAQAEAHASGGPENPAAHMHAHWSYDGEGGPARWAALRGDYAACSAGKRQSPIDIREGIRVNLEEIRFDYRPTQFRIIDNGHTVQVNVGEGLGLTVMGKRYELLQFHFHRPAEERVNGRTYDMVVHLVHRSAEGQLAVVAVLLEKGGEHSLIQTLWNNLPLEQNVEVGPEEAISLHKLLPEDRAYWTYMGSLTTPPCTEGVLWMVMKQPMQLGPEQVAIFSRLYRNNARPIQPANGRLIKESR